MKSMRIPILLLCGILLSGCAAMGPGTKTMASAKLATYGMGEWFTALHSYTKQMYDSATPDVQLELRKKVNPLVNKLQKTIVPFCDLVILWETTGTKPLNIDKLYDDILRLYDDIMLVTKEVTGK